MLSVSLILNVIRRFLMTKEAYSKVAKVRSIRFAGLHPFYSTAYFTSTSTSIPISTLLPLLLIAIVVIVVLLTRKLQR